eukprot:TRINITY_DN76194_c0_g1_i1.p1 TRINITY_DN76194_c0_g1~~TRINITY_DN76194_c0_g1_i1.p1  ORF type:complete len:435 (+),score=85.92 TRINITY_DN76194_c0_g1_i1:73-1377(+)
MPRAKVGKLFLYLSFWNAQLVTCHDAVANTSDACDGSRTEQESEESVMLQASDLRHVISKGVRTTLTGAEDGLQHARQGLMFNKDETTPSYAMSWFVIVLLALAPLCKLREEDSSAPFCRTDLITILFYYLWLIGGLWMLCYGMKFQSDYWSTPQPLHWPAAVYVMIQIVLTIGYGDITPASERGRMFMTVYIVVSLFVVAGMLMSAVNMFVTKLGAAEARALQALAEAVSPRSLQGQSQAEQHEEKNMQLWYQEPVKRVNTKALASSIGFFFSIVLLGATILHYNSQKLSWIDAFYMCVVTSSTVGFGDFTFTSRFDEAYGAMWMCLGVASFANMGVQFALFVDAHQARDRSSFNFEQSKEKLDALLYTASKEDKLDANAFLRLSLQQAGLATDTQLAKIDQIFKQLDPDGSGKVDKAKVRGGMVPASMSISS